MSVEPPNLGIRTAAPPGLAAPNPSRPGGNRVYGALARPFVRGLVAILPLVAAILVLLYLGSFLEAVFRPPIEWALPLHPDAARTYYVRGMGFVLGLLVIFLLGLAVNAWIVRQFIAGSERVLQQLPLAKTVMSSVRDVTGFFSKSEKRQMSQVVLVPMTALGGAAAGSARLLGFVTRSDLSDMPAPLGGPDVVAVYFPFSYAMGGFTAIVPRASLQVVEMTAEEAMRFAITAGMKAEHAAGDGTEPAPAPHTQSV